MFISWLKKYRWDIVVAVGLMIVFCFSRLIKLTTLPIFVDEAIYLRWAQIAKNDANWRFISLTDGKQPLFVWITMIVMSLVRDPITAGRLVSLFCGLSSMVAIWVLAMMLFKNRRLAFIASLFYLVSPFALVYDRMALMDAMVGTFGLLSSILAVLLVRTGRLDVALILGAVLGGGVLTKTSGFLNIYLLPVSLLFFNWQTKHKRRGLLQWLGLVIIAVVVSQFFYNILRLSPFFYIINQKNTLFVYPLKEWLKHPFYYLKSHFDGLSNWLVVYLTWPVLTLIIYSLVVIRKQLKPKLALLGWFGIPFFGLVLFGNILYPRFIFFITLNLYILAAWSIDEIATRLKKGPLLVLLLIVSIILPLKVDAQLLVDPKTAPIARSDRDQYILSWPAGYGIKEIIAFAKVESKKGKLFIATEGTFGLMPASLELYLWDNPNIQVKGYFPVNEISKEVIEKAQVMPTYFIFNETVEVPGSWPLKLVAKYLRPDQGYSLRLYQVVSPLSK